MFFELAFGFLVLLRDRDCRDMFLELAFGCVVFVGCSLESLHAGAYALRADGAQVHLVVKAPEYVSFC